MFYDMKDLQRCQLFENFVSGYETKNVEEIFHLRVAILLKV